MFEWPGAAIFRRMRSSARRGSASHLDLEQSSTPRGAAEQVEKESSGLFYFHPASRAETDIDDSSVVDIVAVHGLGGHWEATWRKGDIVWLRDLLPSQLHDEVGCNVRVLSYGYQASMFFTDSRMNIRNAANMLLEALYHERESDAERKRKLVFVAHSVGGVVVKQLMIAAHENQQRYKQLSDAILGIIFLAVPHRGAALANHASRLTKAMAHIPGFQVNPAIIKELRSESEEFFRYARSWTMRAAPLHIRSFHEQQTTNGQLVVDEQSATLNLSNEVSIGIHANHITICKFDRKNDQQYMQIWSAVKELARYAQASTKETMSTVDGSRARRREDQIVDEVLHSLAFSGMFDRRDSIKTAHPGTCQWLLTHPSFVAWDDSHRGLFWIRGDPGSGKSVLMSRLQHSIDDDRKYAHHDKVSFFFNARGSYLQRSEEGMYRAIVHQVYRLSPFVRKMVNAEHRLKKSTGHESIVWHMEEMKRFLASYLRHNSFESPLLILLDALDEAGEIGGRQAASFWHTQMTSTDVEDTPVKICMSSRHYPAIPNRGELSVNVEENNADDIHTFIKDELNVESFRSSGSYTLRRHTQKVLTKGRVGAVGNFQWLSLIVPELARLIDDGELRTHHMVDKLIRQVPCDLESTYAWVLEHVIKPEYRFDSFRLFSIVCLNTSSSLQDVMEYLFSEANSEPLRGLSSSSASEHMSKLDTLDEETIDKLIASRSGGLLRRTHHRKYCNIVQVSHVTVFEYMRADGLCLLWSLMEPAMAGTTAQHCLSYAHSLIFDACYRWILSASNENVLPVSASDVCKHYPFLTYSSLNILRHGREALYHVGPDKIITALSETILYVRALWCKEEDETYDVPINAGLLRLCVHYDLDELAQALLERAPDRQIAISKENQKYDPNVGDGTILCDYSSNFADHGNASYTLLFEAVLNGNLLIVLLLLQSGAHSDIRVQGQERHEGACTPLMVAVAQNNFAIAQALIEYGADANASNEFHSVLLLACQYSTTDVVRLLFAKGARIDDRINPDNDARRTFTPPMAAAIGARLDVAQELIECGADVNACTQFETVLGAACEQVGGNANLLLLWAKRARSDYKVGGKFENAPPEVYCSDNALFAAIAVRLLAEANADVHITTEGSQTVVSLACLPWIQGLNHSDLDVPKRLRKAFKSVIQLLVRGGAQVSAADVHLVCRSKGHEILPMLLESVRANPAEFAKLRRLASSTNLLFMLLDDIGENFSRKKEDAVLTAVRLLLEPSDATSSAGGPLGMAALRAGMYSIRRLEDHLKSLGVRPSEEQIHQELSAFSNPDRLRVTHLESLLRYGGDPNIEVREGFDVTLIKIAICQGRRDIMRSLIKADALPPAGEWLTAALLALQYVAASAPDRSRFHLNVALQCDDAFLTAWRVKLCETKAQNLRAMDDPSSDVWKGFCRIAKCLISSGARGCVKPGDAMRPSTKKGITLLDVFADIEARAIQNVDLWEGNSDEETSEDEAKESHGLEQSEGTDASEAEEPDGIKYEEREGIVAREPQYRFVLNI